MTKGIKTYINVYHLRNLKVTHLNTYNEFRCINEEIRPVRLNMVVAGEHVGNIERSNRTGKEGTRCHIHRCPYEIYPKVIVTGYVIKYVKGSNQLPSFNGISEKLSSSTLLACDVHSDFNCINTLKCGDYVQVHRQNTPTNTPKARMVGEISLQLSGNEQGGWIFMSLATGRKYTCIHVMCYQLVTT